MKALIYSPDQRPGRGAGHCDDAWRERACAPPRGCSRYTLGGLYELIVLRRSVSFLLLVAVIVAPAVTSTRLFCRYTGQEIVGCAETAAPERAQVREGACCQKRTFHALDGVRLAKEERQQAPTLVAVAAAPVLLAEVFALAAPEPHRTIAPSAGPPAFLSHRALLI